MGISPGLKQAYLDYVVRTTELHFSVRMIALKGHFVCSLGVIIHVFFTLCRRRWLMFMLKLECTVDSI